jgi:5-methylcytosine-specific restriction protein A
MGRTNSPGRTNEQNRRMEPVRVALCAWPGCFSVPASGRYCAKHAEAGLKKDAERKALRPAFQNADRPNDPLYNTCRWRMMRARHLAANPECVRCGSTDQQTVDHIAPPHGDSALFFDESNLQTLCMPCQRLKTVSEINARRA